MQKEHYSSKLLKERGRGNFKYLETWVRGWRQARTRNRECVSVSELPYSVHFHVENAPFVGLANLKSLLFLFPLLYPVANRDRSVRPSQKWI